MVYTFGNIGLETVHVVPFQFERFDFLYWRQWMAANFHIPVSLAVLYIFSVFVSKKWMEGRDPVKLKNILVIWNLSFALCSFVAFLRVLPDLLFALKREDGFYHSVCSRREVLPLIGGTVNAHLSPGSQGQSYPYSFWSWIGTLSKVAELGDTAFLIMRKHDLIFLHWYHHATAMLYTWYIFEAQEPCHRWLMTMNFFIHVLMYSYFALRAAGVKLPRGLAMVITTLQILQMVMGVYVNWFTWNALANGRACDRLDWNLKLAIGMYASYLILFINFFYSSYFRNKKSNKTE